MEDEEEAGPSTRYSPENELVVVSFKRNPKLFGLQPNMEYPDDFEEDDHFKQDEEVMPARRIINDEERKFCGIKASTWIIVCFVASLALLFLLMYEEIAKYLSDGKNNVPVKIIKITATVPSR